MELKKYRLGDIAKVEISGIDKKSKDGQQDVLLCNFVDVYYNWAVTKDLESKFMPATASDSEIESFTLHKGQVAITKDSETRDDIGVATYIADDFDNLVVLGYHTALITPDEEQLCGKYLNALMHSSYFQRYWSNNASGSGQRYTLSQKVIEDAPLYLPDIDIQREIGEFFSDLDRKLCLNKKENETLEAMAKQLYDYWFVQFDFPDSNGRPYKTSGGKMVWNETLKREIPEGWEDCTLIDIANITMGQSPAGSSYNCDGNGMLFYQGSTDFGLRFPDVRQYTTAPTRFAKKGDILMSVRAPVGAINIANNNCCIGRGLAALNSKIGSISHLYFVINDLRIAFERKNAAGTTFGAITKDELHDLPVLKPSNNVLSKYESICKEIFDKQMIIGEEVMLLKKQRDFILPLFMSGQLSL